MDPYGRTKCDIDTRIAFKIKPQKIDLNPFKTGGFDASMKLRYAPNLFKCKSKMQYVSAILLHHCCEFDISDIFELL